MGQPNNNNYRDGASRSIRDPYQRTNVERLLTAVTRWPGISEITLASVFTPGDFFTSPLARGFPLAWTHRIPEVTRTAEAQGLIRVEPTSRPGLNAFYPVPSINPEEVAA